MTCLHNIRSCVIENSGKKASFSVFYMPILFNTCLTVIENCKNAVRSPLLAQLPLQHPISLYQDTLQQFFFNFTGPHHPALLYRSSSFAHPVSASKAKKTYYCCFIYCVQPTRIPTRCNPAIPNCFSLKKYGLSCIELYWWRLYSFFSLHLYFPSSFFHSISHNAYIHATFILRDSTS